jgi:phosphatidylglycerol:prolipoprotein diacylglycerol transferase
MIPIGNGGITWYGFFIALSILLGAAAGYYISRRRGYPKDTAIDMVMWAVPVAVVGARLYYVIFDAINGGHWTVFAGLFDGNASNNFFHIWNGGLAIYGAVLGAILGLYFLSLVYKRNKRLGKKLDPATGKPIEQPTFYQMCDLGAPFLILGQAIGRWGNYVNGEAYGGLVTNPAWQKFPFAVYIDTKLQTGQQAGWYLATFFIESMWCLIGFGLLIWLSFRKKQQFPGFLAAFYMIFYGAGRAVIESFRTDSLWLIPGAIKASIFVAVVFILWGAGILAYNICMRRWPEQTKAFFIKLKLRKPDTVADAPDKPDTPEPDAENKIEN